MCLGIGKQYVWEDGKGDGGEEGAVGEQRQCRGNTDGIPGKRGRFPNPLYSGSHHMVRGHPFRRRFGPYGLAIPSAFPGPHVRPPSLSILFISFSFSPNLIFK